MCAFLSCFHSIASASQNSASAKSISFLATVAISPHMISNAANSSVEYIKLPMVAQVWPVPSERQLTMS
jgi:hypothetical protein